MTLTRTRWSRPVAQLKLPRSIESEVPDGATPIAKIVYQTARSGRSQVIWMKTFANKKDVVCEVYHHNKLLAMDTVGLFETPMDVARGLVAKNCIPDSTEEELLFLYYDRDDGHEYWENAVGERV